MQPYIPGPGLGPGALRQTSNPQFSTPASLLQGFDSLIGYDSEILDGNVSQGQPVKVCLAFIQTCFGSIIQYSA